jgi:hypothetical protein
MGFFETLEILKKDKDRENPNDFLFLLEDGIREALDLYWKTASMILEGSGTHLLAPANSYYEIRNNFFSMIFLYSYHRAGVSEKHRVIYAAINQCLRGIVTGCDNILDDEYKKTLDTDLPEGGTRFRSVLDIMVSDRVIFHILCKAMEPESFSRDAVLKACDVSLHGLLQSGVQEATEEAGIARILYPDEILSMVHHYKTGLLFQAPWAVPRLFETVPPDSMDRMMKSLYDIGMGCQILDDITDLSFDMKRHRHNYVLSLLYHCAADGLRKRLDAMLKPGGVLTHDNNLLAEFPQIKDEASKRALLFLNAGFKALFDASHQSLVEPAIEFVTQRLGDGLVRSE